LVFDYGFRLWF